MLPRSALLAALPLLAGALLLPAGPAPGAQTPDAPPLPPELRAVPVDPLPGKLLAATVESWVRLQAIDPAGGFLTAKAEPDGRPLALRLLPYAALQRFGEAGAPPAEYRAGDRLLLRTVPVRRGRVTDLYVTEVRDEITEQLRLGHCYEMKAVDLNTYSFTADPRAVRPGAPLPPPLAIDYGRGTVLVLREDPVYTFKVAPGTRLWINTGYPGTSGARTAREVLDEVSLKRFQSQQRLRLIARADAGGAPCLMVRRAAGECVVRVYPDYAAWARWLRAGDSVQLARAGTPPAGPGLAVRAPAAEGAFELSLAGGAADLRPGAAVRLHFRRTGVSYQRDIRAMLDVNCLYCHRPGDARSGYSLEPPERMRAGSRRGPGIVPGKSAESLLYLTMTGERNPRMPPDRDATPEQLALLKSWIDAGAAMD